MLGILVFVIFGSTLLEYNALVAIHIIVVGSIGVWASFLCLYGFGELISETTANRDTNDRILEILEAQYGKTPEGPASLESSSEQNNAWDGKIHLY